MTTAPGLDLSSRAPDGFELMRSTGVRRITGDLILRWVTAASAGAIVLMLGSLLVVLTIGAMPSVRHFGLRFISSSDWRPNELERQVRGPDGRIVRDADGEPVTETIPPAFGALPVIYGTVMSSALAVCVAVPLSLGAALFLVRVAPARLRAPVSFLIEFLAAIPSIAYGIWGLFVLAPLLQGNLRMWGPPGAGAAAFAPHRLLDYVRLGWINAWDWARWIAMLPGMRSFFDFVPDGSISFHGVEPLLSQTLGHVYGFGWLFAEKMPDGGTRLIPLTGRDLFCGGLLLAIMIVPIITAVSRDVLRAVPRAQIEGSVALGATWWQSCREMLKYSRSGLFGAVMLGLARAAGETMAVAMVIGNNQQIKASPFQPAQTMSSLLANEFTEANGLLHPAALIEVALILLVMSLLFNVVARYLVVGKQSRSAAAH